MKPFCVALFAVAVLSVGSAAATPRLIPDPCAGHVTPDGIHADQMGPCDEMPGGR